MLPPGRAGLAATPSPTGSALDATITIGIVAGASRAAREECVNDIVDKYSSVHRTAVSIDRQVDAAATRIRGPRANER